MSEAPVAKKPSEDISDYKDAARLKRNLREVYVGNDLYPTEGRARLFGISKEELAKNFWEEP